MAFEDILGYAALAGVVLVVIGTILLALFPRWGGFRVQRADEAPPSPLEAIVKALVAAFTGFLTIVRDMVTGEAGKYHPGQIFIAVGFLLFVLCGLLWAVTQVAGG